MKTKSSIDEVIKNKTSTVPAKILREVVGTGPRNPAA